MAQSIERAIAIARTNIARFAAASEATDAYRVLNGVACGLDGLVVERYGPVLIAQLHEGRLQLDEAALHPVLVALRSEAAAVAVYRKIFPRERSANLANLNALHGAAQPWIGEAVSEELRVLEGGAAYLVRPYDGYSTGLFLEQRDNRTRIRKQASGRRVLNLFAYTCGFSVAAGQGGAAEVTSVDVSRKYLEWGKRNLAANALALDTQRFICSDVFDYFARARRQGRRFDLVIIDPPTFARIKGAKRPFVLASDLDRLVADAVALLDPGGLVLLCTNHRGTTMRTLEHALHAAAAPRRARILERPALPPDFSDDPEFARSILASVE